MSVNRLLSDALERIEELENQWISVEDRLPDSFGEFLVCGAGFMGCDYFNETINSFAYRDDATHWMPLPPPPMKDN